MTAAIASHERLQGVEIIGEAAKDPNNGSRRVKYRCACGYEGTTRAVRADGLKGCRVCTSKYGRLMQNAYRVEGETAFIDISTEKFPGAETAIDLDQLDLVLDGKGRWYAADFNTGVVYAVRSSRGTKLHRHLLGLNGKSVVDHIDGNGLNNRRANIRECSQSMNLRNRALCRRNKSGVIGVVPAAGAGRWIAQGTCEGVHYHFGTFATVEEAAKVRREFEETHGFGPNHGSARA